MSMYATRSNYGQSDANPKYLKRKVKSGQVSLDMRRKDLVLTYEVEATVVGDTGQAMQTERKQHKMPLKVKLDAHTDVYEYARKLVLSSDLIPNNKVDHVCGLLEELKEEILHERYRADSDTKVKRDLERKRKEERRRQRAEEKRRLEEEKAKEELGNANMDDLDEYVEKLYDEDTDARIRGTRMILHLASEAGNLEDLLENDALMGALSRTLKDDYKQSMELSLVISKILLQFSNFSQFHSCLHGYQIGNNSMQVVKWELKRFEARRQEMKLLAQIADAQSRGEDFDPRKRKKGEPVNLKQEEAKTAKLQRKQDKLLFVCMHVLLNLAEDEKVEKKMAKRGLVHDVVQVLVGRTSNDTELLTLTAMFLKKLSVTRENKDALVEANVVEHLVKFLTCSNVSLKKIVLSTLFNLSFDPSIREQMVNHSMIPKLVDLLAEKQFRAVALRLLYHLSMDDRCKSMFTYTDVIPYVMKMVLDFPSNHIAKELGALAINLSLNDRNCAMMCQGNNFKLLAERAIRRQDPLMMKVVRNISEWTLRLQSSIPDPRPEDGKQRAENEGREGRDDGDDGDDDSSDRRGEDGVDSTTLALRRAEKEKQRERERMQNAYYKYRRLWEPHVMDIVNLMQSADNPTVMVEAMGTLANLSTKDLPRSTSFADLIIEHDLVELLHKHLLPGFSEDDVLLQVVILAGQFCLEEAAARLLANSPLVKLIYDLLHEKRDDSEIVLQTLFTFHRLLRHKDTGHSLLYETQMPRDVCELLHHKNKVVQVMADNLLDLIIDHDEENEISMTVARRLARKHSMAGESKRKDMREEDQDDEDEDDGRPELRGFSELKGSLSRMIRAKRFAIHNKEWLEVVAQEEIDDMEDSEPDFSSPDGRNYGKQSPDSTYGSGDIDVEYFKKQLGHHDDDDDDDESDLTESDDESTEYS